VRYWVPTSFAPSGVVAMFSRVLSQIWVERRKKLLRAQSE
jgi:hypothetical protein